MLFQIILILIYLVNILMLLFYFIGGRDIGIFEGLAVLRVRWRSGGVCGIFVISGGGRLSLAFCFNLILVNFVSQVTESLIFPKLYLDLESTPIYTFVSNQTSPAPNNSNNHNMHS